MKRIITLIPGLLLALVLFAQELPERPNPPRLVNDRANLLTPDQQNALERKLVAFDDSTSNQIAIVILESIGDADPGDYATELGRKWGVGGSQFNNGVVLFITTGGGQGRRHVFIAPGYGLERAIPDITAKQIVDNELIPYLREGDYFRGINNAVDALMKAAAGEYKVTRRKKSKDGPGGFLILLVIFIIIMIISRRGGGGRGGGMMSRRGYRGSAVPPIWWFPTGGGGGSRGGGFGGGGGGFGGFGGGGFGGGGAGGNW